MEHEETENARYWEDRYGDLRDQWSGNANALLVDAIDDLTPGTALDLGCGQGGDAIWLAKQGWTVTAVDVAASAMVVAARHAEEAGVAGAITWERHDLSQSFPAGTFDLVSSCYLQSPIEMPRAQMLRASADVVAPGGTLLIVGHAGWPAWMESMEGVSMPTPDEVLADLALAESDWRVDRSELVDRAMTHSHGRAGTRPDGVLRITRIDV